VRLGADEKSPHYGDDRLYVDSQEYCRRGRMGPGARLAHPHVGVGEPGVSVICDPSVLDQSMVSQRQILVLDSVEVTSFLCDGPGTQSLSWASVMPALPQCRQRKPSLRA
jgi:hypothetical protein